MDRALVILVPVWVIAISVALAASIIGHKRFAGWKAVVFPATCIGLIMGPCVFTIPFIQAPVLMPAGLVWPAIGFSLVFEGDSLSSIPRGVVSQPILLAVLSAAVFFVSNKRRKPTST